MLKTFLLVPTIMTCALAGTVGLIKAIEKISPEQFDWNKQEQNKDKDEEEDIQ
ncbi:MAG: hypothetical protein NC452_11915 [Eubacterium sp.]|nr:hypothetical protein [Eubacterium sp.]